MQVWFPPQHCCAHVVGLPPLIAQRWKQPMLLAQVKSFRQFSVRLQQLATMHWLHGVPPGSSEQPPSPGKGRPQSPPSQTRPTQHCGVVWQLDPVGRQDPTPQRPFWHWPLQQSPGEPQGNPSSVHWPAQTPLLHWPLQHWSGLMQAAPSGMQFEKPQAPVFGLQKPAQHSKSLTQPKPSGRQFEKPQVNVFGSQKPLQHSKLSKQPKPSGRHWPKPQLKKFGSQKPAQHSKSLKQPKPSGRHSLKPQVPVLGLQAPLQHWPSNGQGRPSGVQVVPPQTPKLQRPEQHCSGPWQPEPSG